MRIRTIKPDYWMDETIGELSIPARLMFIALLNYADDEGNLKVSIKQIKLHTFPYDDIDIVPLMQELTEYKLIRLYVVDGISYCNITNFLKHQRINRPTPSIHPSFSEHSVNNHVLLIDNSQRKEGRKECIGKEEERKKEKKENISFDIVSKLFKEQNCEGAEEFYAKMNALQWRNKNNDLIDNQVSYVLQSIEKLKHGTQAKQTNDSKGIDGNGYATQSKLTGAELRRLQRNNKETN